MDIKENNDEHDYDAKKYEDTIEHLRNLDSPKDDPYYYMVRDKETGNIDFPKSDEKVKKLHDKHYNEDSIGAKLAAMGEKIPYFKKWFTNNIDSRIYDNHHHLQNFINTAYDENPTLLSKFKDISFDPHKEMMEDYYNSHTIKTIPIKNLDLWKKIHSLDSIPLKIDKTRQPYRPLSDTPIYLSYTDPDGIRNDVLMKIREVKDKDGQWQVSLSKNISDKDVDKHAEDYANGYGNYHRENNSDDEPLGGIGKIMYHLGKKDAREKSPWGKSAPHIIKGVLGNKIGENFDRWYENIAEHDKDFLHEIRKDYILDNSRHERNNVAIPSFHNFDRHDSNDLLMALEPIVLKRVYRDIFTNHDKEINKEEFKRKYDEEMDKVTKEYLNPNNRLRKNINRINEETHPSSSLNLGVENTDKELSYDNVARDLLKHHPEIMEENKDIPLAARLWNFYDKGLNDKYSGKASNKRIETIEYMDAMLGKKLGGTTATKLAEHITAIQRALSHSPKK